MEHTLYKVRLELIILSIDAIKPQFDPSRVKILLDNEKIPSIIIRGNIEKNLYEMYELYLKYHPSFIRCFISDVNIIDDEVQLLYCCIVPYVTKLNKIGSFYDISEIKERKVELNDRQWRTIERYSGY